MALAAVVTNVTACSSVPQSAPPDASPNDGASDVREARDAASFDAHGDPSMPMRHAFRRIRLSSEFYCEGATYGDFDRDGDTDVATGPRWYEGPAFTTEHELYLPVAYDPKGYSDCFFLFARDLDEDGWVDVLRVGFPGADASWFKNPGSAGGHWPRHQVVNVVDTESPDFTDITGDGRPELVFSTGGRLGWAGPDPVDATRPWLFHPATLPSGFHAFTHGLGVGDVNGDGRPDFLEATGWWQQPPSLASDPPWARRPASFGSGGAQMAAIDVDGDGDADVVTSLEAHGYGLAWYEQSAGGFVEHIIVPPLADAGGVALHEPHALAVADVDGDGDPDIVTGERFWGHIPAGMPDFSAPAHLYWFELVRTAGAVAWIAHLIDDASGIGTQVTIGDVTADGLADILIANKKGAFVFVHEVATDPVDP
jgi:FG-GAP-like repeat